MRIFETPPRKPRKGGGHADVCRLIEKFTPERFAWLSLRMPQRQSLEILDRIAGIAPPKKDMGL